MPMSISRAAASGAPFACRVVSTRCPVSAASIAICAVTVSRISPTMITSGSARTIARSPVAKVRPVFEFTCTCFTPVSSYSTGSSTVTIVRSGVLSSARPAYRVVVLPDPVGPVTRIAPCVAPIAASKRARSLSSMPSPSRSMTI